MTDVPDKTIERRRERTLTKDSLQRLLNWLDGGADSDGYSYVEIRRRLRDYFARKNCRTADDLADETLTRVARRLEEEGISLTETPARYCYIVARFVFLEHLRETKSHRMVAHPSGNIALQPPASSVLRQSLRSSGILQRTSPCVTFLLVLSTCGPATAQRISRATRSKSRCAPSRRKSSSTVSQLASRSIDYLRSVRLRT